MNMPMISIIIPAYNIDQYISDCLESICVQTLDKKFFEVIVVNDCSTDGTLNTVMQFCEKYDHIKMISNVQNLGPGGARNEAIRRASGRYLLFLDGDDLLVRHGLERLVQEIERASPDAITFNWTYLNHYRESPIPEPRNAYLNDIPTDSRRVTEHFLGGNMDGSVIYTLVKKSILLDNQILFPEGLHEDIFVIFSIYYLAGKVSVLDEILYIKRDRESSIVNTFSTRHIQGMLNSWVQIMDFVLTREGEGSKDLYMHHYRRGINRLVGGLLKRVATVESFHKRVLLYDFIIGHLSKDKQMGGIDLHLMPNITKKDKIARLFFERMLSQEGDMEYRSAMFEREVRL